MPERLDKIIATQTARSRVEAKDLVHLGRVTVDGRPAMDPGQKVDAELQGIAIDGVPLDFRRRLYLMMNKPAGVLCAGRDKKQPTVMDLLPRSLARAGLFTVGRLDKDTEGLLLITDDGEWAHRVISPRHGIYKLYQAELNAPIDDADVAAFAAGIPLSDGTACLPAILSRGEGNAAFAEICEGKYHQIKRMFAARGKTVIGLRRERIGGLWMDITLPPGTCRELTEAERQSVFACADKNSQLRGE